MGDFDSFNVVLLGIIYDPAKRKILLVKRKYDPVPEMSWVFPGSILKRGEDLDESLKRNLKLETGYDVKNLGSIFFSIPPEAENFAIAFFLCETFKGEDKAGEDVLELKWVSPEEVEPHFTTRFPTRLKEYILNLK